MLMQKTGSKSNLLTSLTEAGTFIFNPATAQFEDQTTYSNSPKVQVIGEEDNV